MLKNKFNPLNVSTLVWLLLINALTLSPLLITGYIADDILNSQIRGAMIQKGLSLWGFTSYATTLWLRGGGRLIPLAFYAYSVFYFLRTVVLYKLFVLTVILAGIAAFYRFLRKLSGSEVLAVIAVLLLPLMFQFRASWDPILAFCAQYPLITLLLFSSLNLFLRTLDEGDRRARWLAVLLFLCSSLIFEVTYPMFLVYALVAYLRLKTVRSTARASWPFLATTCCLTLASIILRARAIAISPAYTMHWDSALIIKTYFVQLTGAIPFSYFLFDPHAIFANRTGRWPATVLQLLPLVVLVAAFSVLTLSRKLSGLAGLQNRTGRGGILAAGILLLAIPPSLISLSPKYQAQAWGDCYLPVYLTYFGLSVVLAVGVEKFYWRMAVLRIPGTWMAPLGLCVWILLLGCAYRNNYFVSQVMNRAVWSSRVLLENALRRGLLTGLNRNSVILVNGTDPWDNAEEYSTKTGIRFSVYPMSQAGDLSSVFKGVGGACVPIADQQVCEFTADSLVYTIQIRHLTGGTGAVLLARLEKVYQSNDFVRGLISHEVTAYFRLPDSSEPLSVAVSGQDIGKRTAASIFRADERDLRVLNEGRDWKLTFLQRNSAFDALSLRGEITPGHAGSQILTAKRRDTFELRALGHELLHVAYENDLGTGVEYPAVKFGNDLSIEVLVVPAGSQGPSADILSNHWTDWRGFTIEQVDTQTNRYFAAFGTGREFVDVGNFILTAGRRNYISVQEKDGEARLYLDGKLISRKQLLKPFAESPHSVWVGNFGGRSHPFNGWIQEVLISRGAKSAEMVLRDAQRLVPAATGIVGSRRMR